MDSVFRWCEPGNRPPIELVIRRSNRSAWPMFQKHHYLTHDLNQNAWCFVGFIASNPAVFVSVIPFPHAQRSGFREHRTVTLPDYQGAGIGNAASEAIAALYCARGYPYFSTTSHPAMIRHRLRSKLWKAIRVQKLAAVQGGSKVQVGAFGASSASGARSSSSFEYVGPADPGGWPW